MEKKKRLGRGLDDVADLWLSSSSLPAEDFEDLEDSKDSEDSEHAHADSVNRFPSKTISVICPESVKVKGLLVTNLALELAKLGLGSCILDYGPNGAPVRLMIGNLFQDTSLRENQGNSSNSHQVLRLYGMPSIHIFSRIGNNFSREEKAPLYSDNLFCQITKNNLQESLIFLYHQDSLEVISMMEDMPSNVIIISRPRKESLLISYAYIKTVLKKNSQARVWIIMDEVADQDEAKRAFKLLSETTYRLLSYIFHPIEFLGSMVHDQALGISLATHSPFALSEENSSAKESITCIATNLIKIIENLY